MVVLDAAANLTFLWPEIGEPSGRFEAAAANGFRCVERLFVHDLDVETVSATLDRHDLELVLFDPYAGDWGAGERGLLCDPARNDELVASIDDAFNAAEQLGVRLLNVLAGNRPPHVAEQVAIEVVEERLHRLAPLAAERGITLLLEAINRIDMPEYLVHDVRVAATIVQAVDHDAVGLLFDAYHVAMAGLDVVDELRDAMPLVRHVQVADVPGRHEPGSGGVDYRAFLDALETGGYAGRIGLEFHPSGPTDATLEGLRRAFPVLGW
jgi:hydroxypyruvate isomerase